MNSCHNYVKLSEWSLLGEQAYDNTFSGAFIRVCRFIVALFVKWINNHTFVVSNNISYSWLWITQQGWNFTNHVITSVAANHSAAVEATELCSSKKSAAQIFVRQVVHAGPIRCVFYNQVIETYVQDAALCNRYIWYHSPDVVTSFILCRCRRFSPNKYLCVSNIKL